MTIDRATHYALWNMKIRIGTRKSALALRQAEIVAAKLAALHPGLSCEILPMSTTGDELKQPLTEFGGKGLFTKEIEEALLDGRADIGVHSMKDMPTKLPPGLIIGCVPERDDPRDALISKDQRLLDDLPKGAVFASSSLRRSAQVKAIRPDLSIAPLRGNVTTRIEKIHRGDAGATMLAIAGLKRIGLEHEASEIFSTAIILPAVGQGALAIECREKDEKVRALLEPLSHPTTFAAILCERAFLAELDGNCRTPIAGYAEVINGLHFEGWVGDKDGARTSHIKIHGDAADAEALGREAGKEIFGKAADILRKMRA